MSRGVREVRGIASTERIDLEAWVRDYVRAVFEAKGYTMPIGVKRAGNSGRAAPEYRGADDEALKWRGRG